MERLCGYELMSTQSIIIELDEWNIHHFYICWVSRFF